MYFLIKPWIWFVIPTRDFFFRFAADTPQKTTLNSKKIMEIRVFSLQNVRHEMKNVPKMIKSKKSHRWRKPRALHCRTKKIRSAWSGIAVVQSKPEKSHLCSKHLCQKNKRRSWVCCQGQNLVSRASVQLAVDCSQFGEHNDADHDEIVRKMIEKEKCKPLIRPTYCLHLSRRQKKLQIPPGRDWHEHEVPACREFREGKDGEGRGRVSLDRTDEQ